MAYRCTRDFQVPLVTALVIFIIFLKENLRSIEVETSSVLLILFVCIIIESDMSVFYFYRKLFS